MKRFFLTLLGILLSITISIAVVIHSFNYLKVDFENAILLGAILSVVELGYIALPYIAKISTASNWLMNKLVTPTVILILFFLSIVPATLSFSDKIRGQITDAVVEMPVEPAKSPLIALNLVQIENLNDQIGTNRKIAEKFTDNKYYTKAQQVLKGNVSLSTQIASLMTKNATFEQDYLTAKSTYQTNLERNRLITSKNTFNKWFNYLKLSYTLMIIFTIQIVNGIIIYYGSSILQGFLDNTSPGKAKKWLRFPSFVKKWKRKEVSQGSVTKPKEVSQGSVTKPKKKTELTKVVNVFVTPQPLYIKAIHKNIIEIITKNNNNNISNDINKVEDELLTFDELLNKFKISQLGQKTVGSLFETFNITDKTSLMKFVNGQYKKKINNEFSGKTAVKLINFCKQIRQQR